MSPLKTVQIELTSRCNERCVHCYIPQDSKRHDMNSALLWKLLDQCRKMGVKRLAFSGGEPMLHPDFQDAIDSTNWEDVTVQIFSNLTKLGDGILATLKANKKHIKEIQASLYSIDPAIHDRVTKVPGSCELTKQGIKRLAAQNIPIFISCPITTINKSCYSGVLAFAKRFGLKCAPNNMITPQSDGTGKNLQYRLNVDDAVQVIREILHHDTAYDAERFLPGYINLDDALPCVQNICGSMICVNAKGEVIPLPGWSRVLGDLTKQALSEIWENSPEIKDLRKISLKDFPKCATCPDIHFCGMSLEGNVNENSEGDPFIIPDYICDCARSTRVLVHSYHTNKKGGTMLYRQKFDTFIRIYDDIGYITNKSDFGDRVVSPSGAVFLSAISREPQELNVIAQKILEKFVDVDMETIVADAKEFYDMLETDGFIVSGETPQECDQKDTRFSYSALEPKTMKNDFTPVILRAEKSSQEFLDEHFKDKPKLISLQIELTSKCNERCVHCYIPHANKTDDIAPELFYDVLEQCREMGLLNLTLSGGEAMLHGIFCDFLRKCKEYDFSVNILSNLTLLTDEIIAELKANRLSSVHVSLYSMNPEIHDSITQVKGSFEKTKNAILKLIENDIPLQISCPTMKQNKNCYVDVINWAKKHRIRAISDYIMMARYDHTTDNLDNRLSLDEVEKVINDIIENDPEYQKQMQEEDVIQEEKRDTSNDIICGICISTICMVANGNVYPCAGWQDYVVGNVKDTPLREIWDNSEKVKYLRGLRKKDFPQCLSCEDKAFCAMCMVRNANEDPNGDPLKINEHFCKVAKLNREIVLRWKEKQNV